MARNGPSATWKRMAKELLFAKVYGGGAQRLLGHLFPTGRPPSAPDWPFRFGPSRRIADQVFTEVVTVDFSSTELRLARRMGLYMDTNETHWSTLNTAGQGEPFAGTGDFHESFSNFAHSIIELPLWEGGPAVRWPTVEHYFQAMKTMDPVVREQIRRAVSPGSAKVKGRGAVLRPDWDQVRETVMLTALRAKFSRPPFREFLFYFKGPIVEWNTWHDRIWGVCICRTCGGTGQNLLGKALETVRAELFESIPLEVREPGEQCQT